MATEPHWDTIEETHQVEVSPQARKMFTALREKPELLSEVAHHFELGWPTEQLIGPWGVDPGGILPIALGRWIHGNVGAIGEIGHAALCPFTAEGHVGDQWLVSVRVEGDFLRRIFDDPFAAATWADEQLESHGMFITGKLDLEILAERQDQQELEEARRLKEATMDIPF